MNTIEISVPSIFKLSTVVKGHGWYDLLPFDWDDDQGTLKYSFLTERRRVAQVSIEQPGEKLVIQLVGRGVSDAEVVAVVCRVLRTDEDLDDFYRKTQNRSDLKWVGRLGAGRLLRSATVYEDLVKTICTTNCTWSLTKVMVTNLVDKLGMKVGDSHTFPDAVAMANADPDFYVKEIKAGYRSAYLHELAVRVAGGEIDPESWLSSDLDTPLLKKEMKKVKGVGDYAAEHMLKLLGRYDGLALDSWIRSRFYEKYRGGDKCSDEDIAAHYRDYNEWRGLAVWCDVTESWFDEIENK